MQRDIETARNTVLRNLQNRNNLYSVTQMVSELLQTNAQKMKTIQTEEHSDALSPKNTKALEPVIMAISNEPSFETS